MAKLVKKYKTSTSKFRKIQKLIIRNKRESIIVSLFVVVMISLLGIGGYTQYTSDIDKSNVLIMRQSVSKLMARFGNVGIKQERVDRSSCEVSRASAFGDKTQYFCNAYYTLSYPITNQNDIDRLVNVITNTVNQSTDIIYGIDDNSTGEIKLSDIKAENTFYTATNFMLKSVKTVRGGCYIRYLVSQNQDFVDVGVECTANTKKAYFEPIEYK